MKNVGYAVALAIVFAFALGKVALPASVTQPTAAVIEAQCRPFFHSACSEAMGRWLPTFGFSSTWWDDAKHVGKRDGFIYGTDRSPRIELGSAGPFDGTFFAYGNAGPPKGHALYDRVHRIAFYEQGCCTWNDVVAAADTGAPPKNVRARDLQNLSTVRGARLWQTEAEIMKKYGTTKRVPISGHPGVVVLPYTTWGPRKSVTVVPSCGQFQNFFFRSDRLILIQIGDGC